MALKNGGVLSNCAWISRRCGVEEEPYRRWKNDGKKEKRSKQRSRIVVVIEVVEEF